MLKNRVEERVVCLEGKKVVLRPPNKETDLEKCVKWVNDEEIVGFTQMSPPITKKAEEEWFDKPKPQDKIFMIETKKGGHLIGVIGVHNINWTDRIATSGTIIGEKSFWNKGYGTDAKILLLHYAFHMLNLRKINSSAMGFNKRSIKYNEKCGYKVVGVLKKNRFRKGQYCDEVLLSVFKEDFELLWKKYRGG